MGSWGDWLGWGGLFCLPPILALIIIQVVRSRLGQAAMKRMIKAGGFLAFDSGPLHSQPAMWLAILIPIFFLIGFASVIVYQEGVDLSAIGLKNFLSWTSPILPIAGIGVAVAALIARMHATVQNHESLTSAKAQNTFKNYLEHRAYVKESLSEIKNPLIDEECHPLNFYRLVFPGNSPYSLSLSAKIHEDGSSALGRFMDEIDAVTEEFFSRDAWFGFDLKDLERDVMIVIYNAILECGLTPSDNKDYWDEDVKVDVRARVRRILIRVKMFSYLLKGLAYIGQIEDEDYKMKRVKVLNFILRSRRFDEEVYMAIRGYIVNPGTELPNRI